MKLLAIHYIDREPSAVPPRVAAGKIFDATEDEAKILLPIRAARRATKDEIALAEAKGETTKAAAEAEAKAAAEAESVDRAGLEAQAKELNVKFNANLSDEKLAERVAEAAARAAAGADDTLV